MNYYYINYWPCYFKWNCATPIVGGMGTEIRERDLPAPMTESEIRQSLRTIIHVNRKENLDTLLATWTIYDKYLANLFKEELSGDWILKPSEIPLGGIPKE